MVERHPDIVIIGAGIAGLWVFHSLKKRGYDVLLLENRSIGGGQSIASQGIIHSGLKYAFAGKLSPLARSISAMPDLWRQAFNGKGDVDLTAARLNAPSQQLLIPAGLMRGLLTLVTKRALGNGVRDIPASLWSDSLMNSGFMGTLIHMDEPVVDVPSVIRALAEPYASSIRKIDDGIDIQTFLKRHHINPKRIIYTAAGSNHAIAEQYAQNKGLKTQSRPLLMGMLKPAPFTLYAHLVGTSDKPVASITTHIMKDGTPIWYIGGQVAEREKHIPQDELIRAIRFALKKYMPLVDLANVEWSSLPIDRFEGNSTTEGWLPDTPTIHETDNALYCWPTKLAFAPLLAQGILQRLEGADITPSGHQTDWGFLEHAPYSHAPWDNAEWTK